MPAKHGRRDFGNVRQERSGRWTARVPIPGSGGNMRAIGTFDTKRGAEQALAVERASILTGTWVDPERGTELLTAYATAFIATNGYRDRSLALNTRLLEQWIDATHFAKVGRSTIAVSLGSRPLKSIEAQDVRTWHAAVKAESRRRAVLRQQSAATNPKAVNAEIRRWARAQGLQVAASGRIPADVRSAWVGSGGPDRLKPDASPTAGDTEAAQAYRLLHAVLERARGDGLIRANPAAIRGAGSVATLERKPATLEELTTAAAAMPARYRAAVWVAALTSVRSGELFALRRKDYHAKDRTLRIERSVELEAASDDFGKVKHSSSLRTVVVPKVAAEALEAHLAIHTGTEPDALIFTTGTGGIVYPDRISKHWSKARREAGRDDLHWHDLRHTGQSLAAAAGAGLKELQSRAGHSTTSAAVRYMHLVQDADRRVADALDDLVERGRAPKAQPTEANQV